MSGMKWGWNDTLEPGYEGSRSFTFPKNNGKNDILVTYLTYHLSGVI